jgi:hypothetical protein
VRHEQRACSSCDHVSVACCVLQAAVLLLVLRVAGRSGDHDLWAYEDALISIRDGGIARVPASTGNLHGVMSGSLKGSLAGERPFELQDFYDPSSQYNDDIERVLTACTGHHA